MTPHARGAWLRVGVSAALIVTVRLSVDGGSIIARLRGFEPVPVLLALLIGVAQVPVSASMGIAGWGLREGAASLAWPLAGRPETEGVAASVAYGLLVLVSALPGGLDIMD